jgi:hydrogenase maturation protease
MSGRVTVLVCGDTMRGDDGLGIRAAAGIPAATTALAEIREIGQLSPDDLLDATGPVIVVDAVYGPSPGELVDMPLVDLAGSAQHALSPSTHALPLPTAVALCIQLRGEAPQGRFLGLAGADFGIGAGVSASVAEALPQLTTAIERWIGALAHPAALATATTTLEGDRA